MSENSKNPKSPSASSTSDSKWKELEEMTDECLKKVRETIRGYVFDFHVDEIPPDPEEEEKIIEELSTAEKPPEASRSARVSEILDRKAKEEILDEEDIEFEKEDAKIVPRKSGGRKSILMVKNEKGKWKKYSKK